MLGGSQRKRGGESRNFGVEEGILDESLFICLFLESNKYSKRFFLNIILRFKILYAGDGEEEVAEILGIEG